MQRGVKNFGVCMIQMNVTDNKDENNTNVIRMIRTAVQKHSPKIVVLPESFNTPHGKRDYFERYAEIVPTGDTCMMLSNIAKELKVYVVGGSIPERDEQKKDRFYNTMVVFSPTGVLLAKHRQLHIVDIDVINEFKMKETDFLTYGNTLTMIDVDGVKIGLGVCLDLFYCEMATLYRKNGCDMLLYTTAYPEKLGEMHTELLTRTRAVDNQMFVVNMTPARNERTDYVCYGHTIVCDGFGRIVKRAGDREEILFHEIDFTDLVKCRTQMPITDRRRTDVYDTIYKM